MLPQFSPPPNLQVKQQQQQQQQQNRNVSNFMEGAECIGNDTKLLKLQEWLNYHQHVLLHAPLFLASRELGAAASAAAAADTHASFRYAYVYV